MVKICLMSDTNPDLSIAGVMLEDDQFLDLVGYVFKPDGGLSAMTLHQLVFLRDTLLEEPKKD